MTVTDQASKILATKEYRQGTDLIEALKGKLVFLVERYLETNPPSDDLLDRLARKHFGAPEIIENVHAWLRSTNLAKVVVFAGIVGMDINELAPFPNPV